MKTLPQFGSDARPKRIYEMCSWLTEHCCKKISLDDISRAFNLSKFYITREFKRHMGMTVLDFIQGERLKIAKTLLSNTDMAIADITEYVGYMNQSAFCRLFHNKEGITALEYRKQWENI